MKGISEGGSAKRFVAVAGKIGVGKSTLVELLSKRLGWAPFYEPEGENPYLADFYQDMTAWSFHSQIFFLTRRLLAHRQLLDHPTGTRGSVPSRRAPFGVPQTRWPAPPRGIRRGRHVSTTS